MNSNQLFDYNVSFSFGKAHCNFNSMIYFLDSTGPIHNITCSSCTCLPLFAIHCPFPASSLRASVHSQKHFFALPPPVVLTGTFVQLVLLFLMLTINIFSTTRMYIKQIIISFLYIYYVSFKTYHFYYGIVLDQVSFLCQVHGMWNRCMTFADCRPQTADCRLQTADRRLQTA